MKHQCFWYTGTRIGPCPNTDACNFERYKFARAYPTRTLMFRATGDVDVRHRLDRSSRSRDQINRYMFWTRSIYLPRICVTDSQLASSEYSRSRMGACCDVTLHFVPSLTPSRPACVKSLHLGQPPKSLRLTWSDGNMLCEISSNVNEFSASLLRDKISTALLLLFLFVVIIIRDH